MYLGDPTVDPVVVKPWDELTLATPKSVTIAVPSTSMMMFPGFRSRWMTSRRCA